MRTHRCWLPRNNNAVDSVSQGFVRPFVLVVCQEVTAATFRTSYLAAENPVSVLFSLCVDQQSHNRVRCGVKNRASQLVLIFFFFTIEPRVL